MTHTNDRFNVVSSFYDAIQEYLDYKYHTYNSSLNSIEVSDIERGEIAYYDALAEEAVENYHKSSHQRSNTGFENYQGSSDIPLGKLVI